MVSSDFGKLDVMRHLISGEDCAIAGEVIAVAAAPAADTFKKSRRFIQSSPQMAVSSICWNLYLGEVNPLASTEGAGPRFNTEARRRKRNKGMTALIKRKSHIRDLLLTAAQAAAITLCS